MIIIANSGQQPLAVLDDYFSDNIVEQINGGYTLSFSTLLDPDKSPAIAIGNLAIVEGQLFNIVAHRRTRSTDGRVVISVECEQVSYDLLATEFEGGFIQSGNIADVLGMALSGTGFTIGTVEPSGIISVEMREGVTAREVVLEIARKASGELRFDGYEISLLNRRGIVRGIVFALGKNLRGIVKQVDARTVPTQTAYEIDVLELRDLIEFAGLEEFELGDTVQIIDDELGVNEQQRIIEYSYSPKRRINSKVKISALIDDLQSQMYRIQKTTVPKDKYLYGTRIGPDIGFESVRYDKKSRMIANADEFRIQKGDGSGSYTDAIYMDANGDARFTGIVQASQFIGGSIQIGTSFSVNSAGHMVAVGGEFSGEITASIITGGQINGTAITGAQVQTKGAGLYPRVELSATNNLLRAENDANNNVTIFGELSGSPMLRFLSSGPAITNILQLGTTFNISGTGNIAMLTTGGRIDLNAPGGVYVNGVPI